MPLDGVPARGVLSGFQELPFLPSVLNPRVHQLSPHIKETSASVTYLARDVAESGATTIPSWISSIAWAAIRAFDGNRFPQIPPPSSESWDALSPAFHHQKTASETKWDTGLDAFANEGSDSVARVCR